MLYSLHEQSGLNQTRLSGDVIFLKNYSSLLALECAFAYSPQTWFLPHHIPFTTSAQHVHTGKAQVGPLPGMGTHSKLGDWKQ